MAAITGGGDPPVVDPLVVESKKIKSVTASSSICHEVMGLDAVILVFFNVEFQASFFTLLFHPHHEAL